MGKKPVGKVASLKNASELDLVPTILQFKWGDKNGLAKLFWDVFEKSDLSEAEVETHLNKNGVSVEKAKRTKLEADGFFSRDREIDVYLDSKSYVERIKEIVETPVS